MNRKNIFAAITLGLALAAMLTSGCSRKPTSLTYIPGQAGGAITNDVGTPGIERVTPVEPVMPPKENAVKPVPVAPMNPNDGIPLPPREKRAQYNEDREFFKANTVYFEFDRSALRAAERGKADGVATALKGRAEVCVEIEGHCDERGTEEYNRSLGERRALSVREYLVNLGIAPDRIFTVTFGKDRPVETGHNDAAWTKNRRGEFILLTPKNK